MDQLVIQPLAVGGAGGVAFFEFVVLNDPALPGVHQQHFAGGQAGFPHNLFRRHVQHPDFGGEDQPLVGGDIVPAGAEAVAVEHRAHDVAVGEEDGGGAVPGLHHRGVVLVEVPAVPAH